ncbi:MAG: urease accessory UreF family protein, partial [Pseudomonadota bacterium]
MAEAAAAPAVDPRLWMLVSPTLPVGGYSYSQGIEHAVLCGRLNSAADVSNWVSGLLDAAIGRVDLPILARLYQASEAADPAAVKYWNRQLLARRETAELRREDLLMGEALERLIADLQLPALPAMGQRATFALALARASLAFTIPLLSCLTAYGWIWCDNQIAAAVKLVPLGQTDGQRLLLALTEQLQDTVA